MLGLINTMIELNGTGQHSLEIESEDHKLTLRQFTLSDAPDIFNLINESEASRDHLSQFGDKTAQKYDSLQKVVNSIVSPPNPNRVRLGIHDNTQGGRLIGSINLTPTIENPRRAEIGYYLGRAFSGKRQGYIERALDALTATAFNSGNFDELFAEVVDGNAASARVLEKAGYTLSDERMESEEGQEKALLVYTKKRD